MYNCMKHIPLTFGSLNRGVPSHFGLLPDEETKRTDEEFDRTRNVTIQASFFCFTPMQFVYDLT